VAVLDESVSFVLEKPSALEKPSQNLRHACPACKSTDFAELFSRREWAKVANAQADCRPRFAAAMDAEPALAFEAFCRCDRCKTIFTDRVPPESALANFYQKYYGNSGYLHKIKRKLALEKRRIFLLKFLVRGRRFLDVGSNIGCSVEAARWNGFVAKGLELDETAVGIAREQFPLNRFQAGSVGDLGLGERFDLVYCSEVVEHVPDPQSFVAAVAAVVAPGGVLMLTTPDSGHSRVRDDLLHWDGVKPPEHLTLFTRAGIRAALAPYFGKIWILPNTKPGLQVIAFRTK
jgi:2-polyprenyl-3-methyl-5-hydroxy-6-metoxy-1,4-benzoquinol methylase